MKRVSAFTLVELMVIIVIIGILTTLVATNLSIARTKSRNGQMKSSLTQYGRSVQLYVINDAINETPISASRDLVAGQDANYPNASAPLGGDKSCYDRNNVAQRCLVNAYGINAVEDGAFNALFSGREITSDNQLNSYGVRAAAMPAKGYVLYYMTTDTVLPGFANRRSAGLDHLLIADLSPIGGEEDDARFYVLKQGSIRPVTDTGLAGGSVTASSFNYYQPSFAPLSAN